MGSHVLPLPHPAQLGHTGRGRLAGGWARAPPPSRHGAQLGWGGEGWSLRAHGQQHTPLRRAAGSARLVPRQPSLQSANGKLSVLGEVSPPPLQKLHF